MPARTEAPENLPSPNALCRTPEPYQNHTVHPTALYSSGSGSKHLLQSDFPDSPACHISFKNGIELAAC